MKTLPGLGRRKAPDDRDLRFLLKRKLAAPGEVMLPSRKTWPISGHSLDQGETGSCVGHAWRNFLRCAPIKTEKSGPSQWDIYRGCVAIDEWSDNDNEVNYSDGDPRLDSGTSVRAGAKVVTAAGRLKSYAWAFELAPVIEWVLTQSAAVLGVSWYSSFMYPAADGLIKITPSARPIGGHAVLLRGIDMRRALATIENSWSDEWGKGGACYLPLTDLERLIHEDGEACVALEQKLQPAKVTK